MLYAEEDMQRSERNNTAVTAKDIGDALGLSQPTVSRILSGAKGHRVSPETRARVLEAAQQMGYRPNAVARSLRRRHTNIIGFYTGYGYLDARNAFLATIIGSLQQAATQKRLDLLLHGVFRGASTDDIYAELVDGRVDGLFLHTHSGDPLAEKLASNTTLPVVAVADALPGLPSVVCDDEKGTRLLVEYLWEKGHRRIAYVYPTKQFASVDRRIETFRSIMAERGGDASLFGINIEETAPALAEMRAQSEPPTAALCWNDLAAFDLIQSCKESGVRVPDDLAVVGFDGLLDPKLTVRPLTTVGADWNAIGEKAMELLTARIVVRFSEAKPEEPAVVTLPVRLIAGDTA